MATARGMLIREGEILPRLTLTGADGPRSIPRPGGRSLLLIFVHPGQCGTCATYLRELSEVAGDLQGWGADLVPVGREGEVVEDVPALLGDDEDAARLRLGIDVDEAAVILADRWGEVMEVATIGCDHRLPTSRQLLESAKIVDLSCGECNVPGPEWRLDDV